MSGIAVRRSAALGEEWYGRPVLFVGDIDRTLDFYVNRLGFTQGWRYEKLGRAFAAQVERQGCVLIFSSQWPDKVGNGLMFISLNLDAPEDKPAAELLRALDRLRAEFESKGVDVKDGWWGYRLLVVRDPDGNELYFNYPNAGEAPLPGKDDDT
jgi:catechol 2,3-dioxygenase-like lactoylglutathione lyase family enzyme